MPLFFSQNMAQKLPEKKMPSTQAKPMSLSAKVLSAPIQRRAHSAFWVTDGILVIAENKNAFSCWS